MRSLRFVPASIALSRLQRSSYPPIGRAQLACPAPFSLRPPIMSAKAWDCSGQSSSPEVSSSLPPLSAPAHAAYPQTLQSLLLPMVNNRIPQNCDSWPLLGLPFPVPEHSAHSSTTYEQHFSYIRLVAHLLVRTQASLSAGQIPLSPPQIIQSGIFLVPQFHLFCFPPLDGRQMSGEIAQHVLQLVHRFCGSQRHLREKWRQTCPSSQSYRPACASYYPPTLLSSASESQTAQKSAGTLTPLRNAAHSPLSTCPARLSVVPLRSSCLVLSAERLRDLASSALSATDHRQKEKNAYPLCLVLV